MPILTHQDLKKILPQAYPFLLIDRVTDYKEGESLTAVKNITANEWPFEAVADENLSNSHVPETLLIESAAQAVQY